jgi:hypothetical protein
MLLLFLLLDLRDFLLDFLRVLRRAGGIFFNNQAGSGNHTHAHHTVVFHSSVHAMNVLLFVPTLILQKKRVRVT